MSIMGQTQTQVLQNIEKVQNKALRILNFKNPWDQTEQIYKESKMFKLKDIVTISNLKFVYDQMNKLLPRVFENNFINKTRQHLYNTRGNSLDVPQVKTTTYGSNSFTLHAIRTWNFFQNKLSTTTSLPNLTQLKWHNSSNDIIYPNPGTTYTTMPNQNSTDITVT